MTTQKIEALIDKNWGTRSKGRNARIKKILKENLPGIKINSVSTYQQNSASDYWSATVDYVSKNRDFDPNTFPSPIGSSVNHTYCTYDSSTGEGWIEAIHY